MSKAPASQPPYDLHPSVAYVQALIANLQTGTGRSLEAWVAALHQEEPADPRAWLKAQGLGTNQAGFVLQRAGRAPGHAFDDSPEGYLAAAPGYVAAQYAGRKAAWRPLFEAITQRARSLGPEVKICPCETKVSFYRHHVFAELKPLASRLDLGLSLGDPAAIREPSGRVKDTGGFPKKDRITHRVELVSESDLDEALMAWFRQAYERDGN
jgi:predicted transport protein